MPRKISTQKLREAGLTQQQINELMQSQSVRMGPTGEFLIISEAGNIVVTILLWLIGGTISTWVFTNILDLLDIAPWE